MRAIHSGSLGVLRTFTSTYLCQRHFRRKVYIQTCVSRSNPLIKKYNDPILNATQCKGDCFTVLVKGWFDLDASKSNQPFTKTIEVEPTFYQNKQSPPVKLQDTSLPKRNVPPPQPSDRGCAHYSRRLLFWRPPFPFSCQSQCISFNRRTTTQASCYVSPPVQHAVSTSPVANMATQEEYWV